MSAVDGGQAAMTGQEWIQWKTKNFGAKCGYSRGIRPGLPIANLPILPVCQFANVWYFASNEKIKKRVSVSKSLSTNNRNENVEWDTANVVRF